MLDHAGADRRLVEGVETRRWPRGGRGVLRRLLGERAAERISSAIVEHRLRAIWRSTRCDVCHVQWIDRRAFYAARAGLRPLVLTAWGSDLNWLEEPSCPADDREKVGWALRNARLVILDSADLVPLVRRMAGPDVPTLLLPIGIDTGLFRPGYEKEASVLRQEMGVPDGATLVFSPRALSRRYGHASILRAFCIFARKQPGNAFIAFKRYGAEGDGLTEELESIAASAGMSGRLRFLPETPYERLPVLYAAADLVVNFPDLDAFPVTFIEALACERPVATNHLPAYDTYGIGKYLTYAADPTDEGLAEAMERAAADREGSRGRMAEARGEIVAGFDEGAIAERLKACYLSLVQGRAAGAATEAAQ